MRLDKLLANYGIGTRKEVKSLIRKGFVKVNGMIIKKDDFKVDHEIDEIVFDDELIEYRPYVYIMLNKPAGYISATKDNLHPTVLELIEGYENYDLFPVGRLDLDTEGLLLITNDGDFSHKLLAPSRNHSKIYFANIAGVMDEQDIQAFKDGIILNVNNKFEEYFGIMKEKIIGVAYSDWYKTLTLSFDCIERKTDDKVFISCGKIERILEISYEKIHDIFKSNVGELCIYRDTTEEYLLEQQLSSNSNTDFLTGLYNRRYFYEYYSNRHDFEQISILYVDLDCFKSVNDTYGHQIGDEALKISSQVLQELFPNDLIARLGGDEFLVSKKEIISVQQLIEQGNNLIRLLKQRFEKNKYYHNLSASVGISYTNDKNKKIDDLIKESDTALYKAKQTGKSKCCIYKN